MQNKIASALRRLRDKFTVSDQKSPGKKKRLPMIDAHVHYLNFLQRTDGFDSLVRKMDAAGVTHAVLFGIPLTKQWDEHAPNEPMNSRTNDARLYYHAVTDCFLMHEYMQQGEEVRNRFFPFVCGINPNDRNAYKYIERLLDMYPGQFCGIGEILLKHDLLTALSYGEAPRADHPAMLRVYDLAAERRLPVLLHHNISQIGNKQPIYLQEMQAALAHNRKANIIWAHLGIVNGIAIPNLIQIADEMLTTNENLYIELSLVIYHYILKELAQWTPLIEKHADRIILGTDTVNAALGDYEKGARRFDRLLDKLCAETAAKLCRDNILKLIARD